MSKKLWPAGVFLLTTLILFFSFIFTDKVLLSSDQLESGVFFRQMYADFVKDNYTMPLWDKYICSGLPFVDAMHGDTFYPAAILQFIMPMYKALGYKLVLHVFLAGLFMFIFLKSIGLKRVAAYLGGLAYMNAPLFVSLVHPGHDSKMYVTAIFPLAFMFLFKFMNSKDLKFIVYFGFLVGLMILSSGVHVTYFGLWMLFFYFIYKMVVDYVDTKKVSVFTTGSTKFIAGIILSIMIGSISFLPPYFYKQFSIRGSDSKTSYEHAISWGLHPEESMSMIAPEFCGTGTSKSAVLDQIKRQLKVSDLEAKQVYEDRVSESRMESNDTYWGRNYFKLNSDYIGIIPLMLTILALLIYRGEHRKFLYFLSGTALFFWLYSMVDHTPIFYLAYKIIPGVKLLRGQSMSMYLFAFSTVTSMGILIDFVIRNIGVAPEKECYKGFKIFAGIAAILFLISLFPSILNTITGYEISPDSAFIPKIRISAFISLVFLAGAIGLSHYLRLNKISITVFTIFMSILIFADTYRVNYDYIQTVDKNSLGVKFKSDSIIGQLKDNLKNETFRVYNINAYGDNELPIHGIETLTGFHDNELETHRLYRGVNSEGVNTDANLRKGLENGANNLLSISGVKYILYKDDSKKVNIIPNQNYMSRAWLVSDYSVETDNSKIVEQLLNPDFDFRNKIILSEEPKTIFDKSSDDMGEVKSYTWDGNECIISVNMNNDGYLFVSDNYMPYWKVKDQNGVEHQIIRANLTYRAIPLMKGSYDLRFSYESPSYIIGKYLTFAGLLITILTFIFDVKSRRKERLNGGN
ncbi:MAG: hypothetical protein JXR48_17420 [Candidatus Delongbacteria bacterium]|nr:hypothetical protein [Candidatus Delongbacteria bacterium]MBN2836740.1 hypothetical protein [Candidatus Delongbacteria bacterium]